MSHLWSQTYPCVHTTQCFSTLLVSPTRSTLWGAASGQGKLHLSLTFEPQLSGPGCRETQLGEEFLATNRTYQNDASKASGFHFLFWFKCLRKRILLLGSWIPNIKHWVCIWVPKQSWPVSQYHQSCTLSTSAFQVQLFFPSLQKLFIIFLA